MKNSIPKFILSVFILMIGSAKANAQSNDNSLHAFFKGTETEVKNDIKANTITFFVAGLSTDEQVAGFVKKAQAYSKSFSMTTSNSENGQHACKINFIGTPDLKWVLRFFLASSIKDVEQNNIKKDPNTFFKPYM